LWNELISGIGPTFAMRHDLTVEASDILQLALKRGEQSTMSQAYQQDGDEPVRSSHESENPLGIAPAPSKELTVVLTHETYMRRAIAYARVALTNGDTPVGSLVVREGKVIAEGVESVKKKMDISAHAELISIRNACFALGTFDLSGCVLYTTAEPCFMCSYAVRQTHISKVVIGRPTTSTGGISSRHPILTDPWISIWEQPPDIVSGILEAECLALYS